MKFKRTAVAGFLSAAMFASGASAGVYSDTLGKCLVAKSSPDDQMALIRWIFAAMTLHPGISNLSKVAPEQRVQFDGEAGQLFMRLLTVDCRDDTVKAIKYEGLSAISSAFEVIGRAAMTGIMNDPKVAEGLEGLTKGIDESKFTGLAEEAGLAQPKKR
jgi:hypothetical protein